MCSAGTAYRLCVPRFTMPCPPQWRVEQAGPEMGKQEAPSPVWRQLEGQVGWGGRVLQLVLVRAPTSAGTGGKRGSLQRAVLELRA